MAIYVGVAFVLACAVLQVSVKGQGNEPNKEAMRYWESKLGKLQMPREMESQVTKLTSKETATLEAMILNGSVIEDEAMCASAGLLCGAQAPLSHNFAHTLSDWAWCCECNKAEILNHQAMMQYQGEDPRAPYHFFLESKMPVPGSSWPAFLFNHVLAVTQGGFLPPSLASAFQHLPISSFLHALRIPPHSYWATAVSYTKSKCNDFHGSIGIENRFCATSVEAMADFLASELGSLYIQAEMSPVTNMLNGSFVVVNQPELRNPGGAGLHVVCHRMGDSPYQIQACHSIKGTKVYSVKLRSTEDPSVLITNVITCHTNTSSFDPDHIAFTLLGIKAGEAGVCHWTMPGTAAFFQALN